MSYCSGGLLQTATASGKSKTGAKTIMHEKLSLVFTSAMNSNDQKYKQFKGGNK